MGDHIWPSAPVDRGRLDFVSHGETFKQNMVGFEDTIRLKIERWPQQYNYKTFALLLSDVPLASQSL